MVEQLQSWEGAVQQLGSWQGKVGVYLQLRWSTGHGGGVFLAVVNIVGIVQYVTPGHILLIFLV